MMNICGACGASCERTYCNNACRGAAQRKVAVDDATIVAYLEEHGFNYEEAGRHFGCSGNAIKKRAKKVIDVPARQRKLEAHPCPQCGEATKNEKFCSRICFDLASRKVSDETILATIATAKNRQQAAKALGIDKTSLQYRPNKIADPRGTAPLVDGLKDRWHHLAAFTLEVLNCDRCPAHTEGLEPPTLKAKD